MSAVVAASSDVADDGVLHDPGDHGRRRGSFRRKYWTKRQLIIRITQLVLLVAFLLMWEHASGPRGTSLIDEYYISRPSAIWGALQRFAEQGILWRSIYVTLQVTLFGFVLGVVFGMAVGFVLGANRFFSDIMQPFVGAVYSIPRLALIPLLILWFGIGMGSKIAVVTMVVFFLVFFATYSGVRDVDPELVDKLRLMGARSPSIHRKVSLPSAATFILSGLRVSAPYALVGAVTAEMFSSNEGLGYLLVRSSGQFYTAGVFAAISVMMLIGVLLLGVIQAVEKRVLRWKPASTRG